MRCSYAHCRGDAELRLDGVIKVCATCYTKAEAIVLADRLSRSPATEGQRITTPDLFGYKDDYVRMLTVLANTELVRAQAAKLDRMAQAMFSTKGLSHALKHFERMCWFPETDVIPIGILPYDDFYAMIARGMMWKDVGAGLNHGIYSHRLQWHVMMSLVTNDFSVARAEGWDHSAYDLFCSMGEGAAKDLNLWGRLFDASGMPNCTSPNEVEYHVSRAGDWIKARIRNKYAPHKDAFQKMLDSATAHSQTFEPKQRNQALNSKLEALWEPPYRSRHPPYGRIGFEQMAGRGWRNHSRTRRATVKTLRARLHHHGAQR